MPNYDAGHYFLTVLAPVSSDSTMVNQKLHSRRHVIRDVLAQMPSGERTIASQGRGGDAPFARNARTHFARFVVLDDVVFNGKVSGDTVIALLVGFLRKWIGRIGGVAPAATPPVDRLSTPFLIFVADFDAESGADGELRQYLAELWATMRPELVSVFEHCEGFRAIETAEDFFRYIKKCQIETTMPFNDYWSPRPSLTDINLRRYEIGALAAILLGAVGWAATGKAWLFLIGLLAAILAVFLLYRKIVDTARVPFPKSPPPAPGSDLPTVLKALYVQRAFTKQIIDDQGKDEAALYAAFGAFIAENQPHDDTAPTQRPGVIGV